MRQLPSHADLLAQYPIGPMEAVGKLVGGVVESQITKYLWNSCCIRISRCLNYTKHPIPPGGGGVPNPYMGGKTIQTYEGGDKKRYIFNTYDLRAYLTHWYGAPKSFPGTATAKDLGPIKGIILFHFMHSDLFDGTTGTCTNGSPGYFGFPEVVKGSVLVWAA